MFFKKQITTYGDGCKQILGIGAVTFLCISRIEDDVAASGKEMDIEIYRFEGRSMTNKPLARITKSGKKGVVEFRGSNGGKIGHLDGLAIHRRNMPTVPSFFLGGLEEFKEVKRKYDKHNQPKAENTDDSKTSDKDKLKDEQTDESAKKKESKGFFGSLCSCFGGGDEIKNPGKITDSTKDFRIVKLPNYAQQLDGHRRADCMQLELSHEVDSTQDSLLHVCVMVATDFSMFVAPSLEDDKGNK